MIDAKEVAKIIGVELEDWKGNCYGIALKMLEHNLVEGRAVHGCYFGKIAESGYFGQFTKLARHGWIETKDGKIIDPTLWVFLDVEPFIYEGPADPRIYDEGGSTIRRALQKPQPAYDENDKQYELPEDFKQRSAIKAMLGIQRDIVSVSELFWLANVPLEDLGSLATHVYDGLVALKLKVFIPSDHFIKIYQLKSVEDY